MQARFSHKIGPTFAGRLKRLNVNVGDAVRPGQVLGEMDPVDLDDRLRAQQAAVRSAEAALRQAQQLGLKVIPWTVNEPADMARLIDWGVDGLITDYPDRARAVMRDKGMALPAAIQGAKTIN